jgi:uncharacterized membrane protein
MFRRKAVAPRGVFGYLRQVWRQLSRYMVSGLLVWVPLIITIWVTWFVFAKMLFGIESLADRAINAMNRIAETNPQFYFLGGFKYAPGMGILLTIAVFLLTGVLTRYLVGRQLIAAGERILNKIPFISRVYRAVQQIRDVFVGQGAIFHRVCLIEYPRPGLLAIGFVTSEDTKFMERYAQQELMAIFVPTTPNPTSGYLVYLPKEQIILLDMTVEEAMKTIVSAGAYYPGKRSEIPTPEQAGQLT